MVHSKSYANQTKAQFRISLESVWKGFESIQHVWRGLQLIRFQSY